MNADDFVPTPHQRFRVALATGAGMAKGDIALALGITLSVLLKHFKDEMRTGASRCRMEIAEALYAQARKGNVNAARAYATLFTPLETVPRRKSPRSADALPEALSESVSTVQPFLVEGKKARQDAAAVTAHVGTPWEALLSKVVPTDSDRPQ